MKRCLGLRTQKHSKKALEWIEAKKEREEWEKKEGVGSEALKWVKRIFEIPERIGEIETPQETKDIFEFLNMMVSIDIKTINKINNAVDKM